MTEVANIDATCVNSIEDVKRLYKTPDYILRASRKYQEKKKNDPEYIKNKLEKQKQKNEEILQMQSTAGKKCPEYIKKAHNAYIERNKDNPEFMEKLRGYKKRYRDANIDRIREADKLRKREMRARKKAEKEEQQKQQTNMNPVSSVSELVEDTVADTVDKLKL
jgi:hypothetical protein